MPFSFGVNTNSSFSLTLPLPGGFIIKVTSGAKHFWVKSTWFYLVNALTKDAFPTSKMKED